MGQKEPSGEGTEKEAEGKGQRRVHDPWQVVGCVWGGNGGEIRKINGVQN